MMADLICITFETLAKHSHHQGLIRRNVYVFSDGCWCGPLSNKCLI